MSFSEKKQSRFKQNQMQIKGFWLQINKDLIYSKSKIKMGLGFDERKLRKMVEISHNCTN